MSEENEDVLIVENQNLDADETVRSSVLNAIKDSKNFQEAIEKLEKEKLIWYLIGPLRKDEDITEQINLNWKEKFQEFERLIDATHKKLESSLPNQNFLAYSTKDNDFNIRFESKKEPVKISDILRASSEGEVYHISLGRDNQITASKKNGNERHYDFTGSGSSEMIINWQAKDSEGNSIDSSIIIAVGSSGILKVIGEPKFGGLKFTSSLSEEEGDKILKLVEQNKEVFINGKSLLEAFIGMGKNMSDQPIQEEETFIRNLPELPQLPTPDSSGYFSPGTPSSRRSSFSVESEVGDKEFEITDEYIDDDYDKQAMHKDDERKYAQEGLEKDVDGIKAFGKEDEMLFQDLSKQLEDLQRAIFEKDQRIKEQDALIKSLTDENKGVNEVLEENIHLKRELERLKERNQEIEENDKYRLELVESEERVQELRTKLAKNEEANQNRLSEQDREVGRLKQRTDELEQKLKDKGSEIADLKSQLKDQESEIQSTNGANEELQEKLKQSQAELRALQEENTKLKSDLEKIVEGLAEDDREEQLAEQLMEAKKENKTLTDEVNQLAEELNQLQKEKEDLEEAIQQPNIGGKSLADEMAEVNEKKDEEVRNLEEKIKRKDEEMQQIVKSNQRLERNLQDLDRKYREVSGKDKEHIAQLTRQL